MDGWYYKLFDSEFGPVPFEDLVSLAKNNTLSRSDHVRFGDRGPWRAAGSIGNLMAHFPFQAVEKVISVSTMTPPTESWVIEESEDQLSLDDFVISESSEALREPTGYELQTPIHTPELRPAHKAKLRVSTPAHDSRVIEDRTRESAPPAAQKPKAKAGSTSDTRWWCMIKDKEYGPIDLKKLTDWASTGRLHRHDYVRYGLEPYVRADELPQLFPKLPNQPVEAEEKPEPPKESKPQDLMDFLMASPGTAAPATPKRPSASSIAVPTAPRPEPSPTPVPAAPATAGGFSTPASAGFQSMSSPAAAGIAASFGGSSTVRAAAPPRPAPKKVSSGSSSGIGSLLTSPAVLGGGGAVIGVVALYFLLTFSGLLASADVGRVKDMAAALKELSGARSKSKVSADDLKPAVDKVVELGKKYGKELKGTKDKKSKVVLTLANKLEELSNVDLAKPSEDEKKADAALNAAKGALTKAKQTVGVK